MGVVYRARQRSLNRVVALKMIAMADSASPAALARFQLEAETAARLDHPHIVSIFEIGEHDNNPYLAMRLVEGGSLAARRREFLLCPETNMAEARQAQIRIARLLSIVARAVAYAHERGVLHRDLKPSNILLDQHGVPHLTDFGLAKSLDHETGLTQSCELLGTLRYMAPEQAAGKPISRAADIYSVGAILYELLTGPPPFEGSTVDLLRQLTEADPPHPRLLNPSIDHDLATICLKCLDKDPARRYSSALELALDLGRWERFEPIQARQAGPLLRLRRWSIRNPALVTLLLSLSLGIILSLFLLAKANEEKKRKSIALDILRAESARQLQEIWTSTSAFFEIKSETLSAMAGMEVGPLAPGEDRFTIALVAEGNPLDRVLRAAPMFNRLESSMSSADGKTTRFNLRLYKDGARAVEDLVNQQVDFARLNPRELLRARALDPQIRPLVTISPTPGINDAAVIFTRTNSGIRKLSDLRGRSFLFGGTNSILTFWSKVTLVETGLRANDLTRYRYVDRPNDLLPNSATVPAVAIGNPFSSMTPVEAVSAGVYDAGVVLEKRFREVAVEQQLVELYRFHENGDLLVSRGNLPHEATETFQQALLDLRHFPSDQTFLDAPSGFKIATDKDLKEVLSKTKTEAAFEP